MEQFLNGLRLLGKESLADNKIPEKNIRIFIV